MTLVFAIYKHMTYRRILQSINNFYYLCENAVFLKKMQTIVKCNIQETCTALM